MYTYGQIFFEHLPTNHGQLLVNGSLLVKFGGFQPGLKSYILSRRIGSTTGVEHTALDLMKQN